MAAVWFADVVGYTALSARAEDEALALVATLQKVATEEVEAVGGRVVKFVGDAVLAVFDSTDGAVRAALSLLQGFVASPAAVKNRSTLRIGVHIGEIVEASDGDVYGDGVNASSRIQGAAEPGQILLSDAAHEQVGNRAGFSFAEVGTRQLKGLRRPMRLFALVPEGEAPPAPAPAQPKRTQRASHGKRLTGSRAIAIGIVGGLITVMAYGVSTGMGDRDPSRRMARGEELSPADLEVHLNLGVEAYYSGSAAEATRQLEPFLASRGSSELERKGLRYLARSFMESGQPDSARMVLDALLDREPPIVLLIPALESDSLVQLYYEVRRERMGREGMATPSQEFTGAVIFGFQVLIADPEAAQAAREGQFGSAVARMLETDLLSAGVAVMSLEQMSFEGRGDEAYQDLDTALPVGGSEGPSHAIMGSVAIRDDRALLSAWVFEIATGRLVSAQQVSGSLAELLDLPSQVAKGISADTRMGSAG